jgi:hypothetical protein
MVKPRVFVSSTYYDLKHIRNSLKSFIDSFGYEAVLFEYGDIPYDHQLTVAECCILEVAKCDILLDYVYREPCKKCGSSLFLMDKMLFQFTRIGFCDDIHTKQRRARNAISHSLYPSE